MIKLYHHPFSRAAGVVWALEELGEPYELVFVDIMAGAQKAGDVLALNPMGKVPLLVDGEAVVSESAAISLYLADRYASGRLAPRLDDPRRGAYFRWTLFAPSVIEPGSMAKAAGWQYKPGQAGWGEYDAILKSIEQAVSTGPFVLGEMFSMADVVFGGTLRFMTRFGMMTPSSGVAAYIARLDARPALQRADARNTEIAKAHGLNV
jgi:glutathione S-transferase